MKAKIIYEFKDGPWGGANQFLAALRKQFIERGIYTDVDEEADVFLLNSINAFHGFEEIYRLRKAYPDKIFVHRVDGPVFLGRGKDKYIDKGIFCINDKWADATIYQSEWSKAKCIETGMKDNKPNVVICNGSNPEIFNCDGRKTYTGGKIRLIATSWSNNWNKGFDYYKYLDERLDREKYEFVFVGNSPVNFENSISKPPVNSLELAELLKSSDIYITAGKNDACSNSLIEALSCGLPAVVYKDGGHPEIIGNAGETFVDKETMMQAIEKVANNMSAYKKEIRNYDIENVSKKYEDFFNRIVEEETEKKKRDAVGIFWAYIKIKVLRLEIIKRKYIGKIKSKVDIVKRNK